MPNCLRHLNSINQSIRPVDVSRVEINADGCWLLDSRANQSSHIGAIQQRSGQTVLLEDVQVPEETLTVDSDEAAR